jgi:membrane fusion protein (multidrug efflux system)
MSTKLSQFGLILAIAGFSIGCNKGEEAAQGQAGGGGGFALPVEVAVAQRDTVVDAILATGEIEAVQSIELRPEVAGRLREVLVQEGATVSSGTPLFKIDDAEINAEVARLTAERDLSVQALERTRELFEQEASSKSEMELAEANWRSAEARLQLEQVRLDRTTVRAPFSGIVGERFVSVGDYVTTSTPLTTLQTFNPQRAAFNVPERYAQDLAVGQEVTFKVAATSATYTGRVDFVNPVVQLPGRTIEVKANVPNPRHELIPGMFIDVRLATDVRADAIIVPEDAVLPLQGADYMWVIAADTASRREVTLGVRMPGFVEVVEGVGAGEQVVVGGLERLGEGAAVSPTVVERERNADL